MADAEHFSILKSVWPVQQQYLRPQSCVSRSLNSPKLKRTDNKLYYRPLDSQETEGVLLYEN